MKRMELYDLVWSKPMIHLAREFGLSDVGLRKICRNHDIPTPPLGYWAKLAHGKQVQTTPLPEPEGDTEVRIIVRPHKVISPELESVWQEAADREAKEEGVIKVPDTRPDDLHSVAEKIEKALRKARPDAESFIHCDRKGLPEVIIGPGSINRAVIFMDTFFKIFISRGHTLKKQDEAFHLLADEEVFTVRFYETKDRKPHELTAKELRRQEEEGEWRNRYYSEGSREWKAWTEWDYFPSGRLSMEIRDPTATGYGSQDLIGRWHDRRQKKLEDYLPDIMIKLAAAPGVVRHRRAEEAERERIRIEEHERWRKEVARRERAKKRLDFIKEKSAGYAEYQRIAALSDYISKESLPASNEPVDRMARELNKVVAEMRLRFQRDILNREITELGLYGDDDPL